MVCPCCPACWRDSGRPPRHGRFCLTELAVEAVAVAFSIAWLEDAVQDEADEERARRMLAWFRSELYRCFTQRPDALFEACDAMLCRQERVHMLAELSLEPECRRGHGAVYGDGGADGQCSLIAALNAARAVCASTAPAAPPA